MMTVTFLKVKSLSRGSRTVLRRCRPKSTVRTLREDVGIVLSRTALSKTGFRKTALRKTALRKTALCKTALPRNALDVAAYLTTEVNLLRM